MKNIFLFFLSYFFLINYVYSQDKFFQPDDLFHIDHMDSHNKEFTLYFKGREKSILARGEESIILMIIREIFTYIIIQLNRLLHSSLMIGFPHKLNTSYKNMTFLSFLMTLHIIY